MSHTMSLVFLGTSSGGGPCDTRSCSSLALDILGNEEIWLVDCAEGTTRQFALQPYSQRRLRVNNVTKLFITHLHFDHVMGIITLLANVLRRGAGAPLPPRSKPPLVELYGPSGLRTLVRSILTMTMTEMQERYAVHELLSPGDARTGCAEHGMHPAEAPGRDIDCVSTGLWFDIAVEGNMHVDAAPLVHRVPCLGYVFRETTGIERKLVVLGDTCDPSSVRGLAQGCSVLVHEATDAYIPMNIDRALRGDKKTPAMVQHATVAKGHSTPAMAGAFAKAVGAQRLYLNHFSKKFPSPYPRRQDRRRLVILEIERQASEGWGGGNAIAAYDFLRVDIPGAAIKSRFMEPSMDSSGDGEGDEIVPDVSARAELAEKAEKEARRKAKEKEKEKEKVEGQPSSPTSPTSPISPLSPTSPTTPSSPRAKRRPELRNGSSSRNVLRRRSRGG